MKNMICAAVVCVLLLTSVFPGYAADDAGAVDIDLTKLNSTMLYAVVFDMMNDPEKYNGKSVRMSGQLAVYQEEEGGGDVFFACVIADAAACCQQGLEFTPVSAHKWPDDFPAEGGDISIAGKCSMYTGADGRMYPCIADAELLK